MSDQFTDDWPTAARLEWMTEVIHSISDGAMIVLPELWSVGAFSLEGMKPGSYQDGPKKFMGDLGGVPGLLHAGSWIEWTSSGRELSQPAAYNTSYVFDGGERIVDYRKIHLFRDEKKLFRPGSRVVTFDVIDDGVPIRVGLATCFDLRFPEHFRSLALASADVVLVTAAWPLDRVSDWLLLLQARAIENVMYVGAVTSVGTSGGIRLGGGGVMYGPDGQLVSVIETPGVAVGCVDWNMLARVRSERPFLADYREYRSGEVSD